MKGAVSGPALGTALLAGDLETEAQEALVRRGLPRVDLLKVAHHGSSRQAPAFLAATGARAALISVGAVNDYGHPAPLTLRRLRWLGMRPYRTDLSGDIAVVATDDGLAVVVRGKGARAR
jgi:competence protein ComEC